MRRDLKKVRMEPCRCLGKGRTKPRDQEVQRPRGWNVLDVVGESKSSVAEEERPMGRVLGNESERASGQIMQGFRGPGRTLRGSLGRMHINLSRTCLAHSRRSVELLSTSSLYDRVLLTFIFLELNLSPSIYILCTQYLFIELSIYILSSFIVVCVDFVLF